MDVGLIPTNVFPSSNLVLGDGPVPSTFLFIGEAPGREENESGRPFVGPSGRLLNRLLEYYTDLRRPNVYVTNVVKHRPPRNRTPKVGEIKQYLTYLWEEIREVHPKVVVTLGASASKVFDRTIKVTDDHGVARHCEVPDVWSGTLVPWFHPAYALRNPRAFEQLAGDAARIHSEVERLTVVPLVTQYDLVDEGVVVDALLTRWGTFGFDTETTSPTRGRNVFMTDEADMVGYSVSVAPGQGWYVATSSVGVGMKAILESPLWTKVMHNAKFDYKILRKQGVTINGIEDTKLAAYLLGEPRTGLKTLAKQQLGVTPITYEALTGGSPLSELAPERIAPYAAGDSDNTLRLWSLLRRRLIDEQLVALYRDVELPLLTCLADMERVGMGVDASACNRVRDKLLEAANAERTKFLTELSQGIWEGGFNINSGDQLADILENMDAPLKKRTEGGTRYSVDADVLESIRDWNPPLIEPLLAYRKYMKFITYVDGFLELRGPDGRLHTSFNQSGHWEEIGGNAASAPSTGRLSSSGPNLQNVPHHRATVSGVDWGYELRNCIVAAPGYTLLSADLGQEEPRIVAVLANDKTLLDGFLNGRDIYRPATEALYPHTRSDDDDITWKTQWDAWERYTGKQFFLAWYYGAGASRLRKLDPTLTPRLIRDGLELLSRAHPERNTYLEETRTLLYEHGYVTSMYGRKRWISKVWSPKVREREEALREAANMRVQATAADILKIALPRIATRLSEMKSRLVSTVHDEVIIEAFLPEVKWVAEHVFFAFQDLLPGVDLVLETYVGEKWGDRTRLT